MSQSPRILALGQTELSKALTQATNGKVGWVQAIGQVEDVEIRIADARIESRRSLRGRYSLASLNGPMGGPYGMVLSRSTSSGVETIAGTLVSARSLGVQVLLTIAEIETLQPTDGSAPNPNASWAEQVEAAATQKAAAEPVEEDEELMPEAGDLVHHFAFGLCEVLQEKGDSLVLRDLANQNRIREIKIDMLRVSKPTDKDGKRLFHLTRRT
jgi:hypothetical protein